MRSVLPSCGVGLVAVAACVGDNGPETDGGPDSTTNDSAPGDSSGDSSTTGAVTITVQFLDGTHAQNVNVDIGGKVMTTDVNGQATFPDPGPTYTAISTYTEGTNTIVHVYTFFVGLTRRDPTLMFPVRLASKTATINGAVNGAEVTGSSVVARFVFAPTAFVGANGITTTTVDGGGGYAPTNVPFPGSNQKGTLYFYERTTDDAGNANGYPAVAMNTNVALAANSTTTQNFDATAPTTGTVSGAVTVPTTGGWTVSTTQIYGMFGTTPDVLETQGVGPSAFSFVAPNITGVPLLVASNATNTAGATSSVWQANVSVNTSGVALAIPDAPTVASPAQQATVPLATTQFAYNGVTGVAEASIQCFDVGSAVDASEDQTNYFVHILTTASNVVAPVAPEMSVTLPASGSACSFTVGALDGFSSLDALAGPTGYASSFGADWAKASGSFAVSAPVVVTAQ